MAGLGDDAAAAPAAYAHASRAISNLRGAFILILVAFHACLAYLGSTPGPPAAFDKPPFLWLAFPIVDERRFYGFDLYCAWEDVHVMALMFFLSGLFVGPSLERKGAARFALDRLSRLGLPFLFAAPPQMAFFMCGTVRLLVGVLPPGQPARRGSAIYFKVADIHAVVATLEAAGVAVGTPHVVHRTPEAEAWLAEFNDPDGNALALMSEVARSVG